MLNKLGEKGKYLLLDIDRMMVSSQT